MVSGGQGDSFLTQGNTLLRVLQALVQPNVISMSLTIPPVSPTNGDTYVVAAGASGGWLTKDTNIAYWSTDNPSAPTGEWEYYPATRGWLVGNRTNNQVYIFNGTIWISASGTTPDSVQLMSTSQTVGFLSTISTLIQATAGAGITLVLPTAVGVGGQSIKIVMVDTGVGGITIATTSSQTISGGSTYVLTNQWQTVTVESNNSNWLITASAG
jgi:hypothetical protein